MPVAVKRRRCSAACGAGDGVRCKARPGPQRPDAALAGWEEPKRELALHTRSAWALQPNRAERGAERGLYGYTLVQPWELVSQLQVGARVPCRLRPARGRVRAHLAAWEPLRKARCACLRWSVAPSQRAPWRVARGVAHAGCGSYESALVGGAFARERFQ